VYQNLFIAVNIMTALRIPGRWAAGVDHGGMPGFGHHPGFFYPGLFSA
jgi:hypothetical protein